MNKDPRAHIAHDLPLADRIIDDLIKDYIARAADMANAACGYLGDEGVGYRKAVDQMRHLYLAGVDYRLTPRIVDALRRAGLLAERSGEAHNSSGGRAGT